jgi:hypothetical protein
MSTISQFPHCDQRILHAPGECEYCDAHPEWQELREAWGIAFTGHPPADDEWTRQLPCPADFNRPANSGADHRRWGGNKPTSARGDASWPIETLASHMMYGDQGGRKEWPLRERLTRTALAPWRSLQMRRRGYRRDGPFWRFP